MESTPKTKQILVLSLQHLGLMTWHQLFRKNTMDHVKINWVDEDGIYVNLNKDKMTAESVAWMPPDLRLCVAVALQNKCTGLYLRAPADDDSDRMDNILAGLPYYDDANDMQTTFLCTARMEDGSIQTFGAENEEKTTALWQELKEQGCVDLHRERYIELPFRSGVDAFIPHCSVYVERLNTSETTPVWEPCGWKKETADD